MKQQEKNTETEKNKKPEECVAHALVVQREIGEHPLIKALEGHDCLWLGWGGERTQILTTLDLIYERIAHGEI